MIPGVWYDSNNNPSGEAVTVSLPTFKHNVYRVGDLLGPYKVLSGPFLVYGQRKLRHYLLKCRTCGTCCIKSHGELTDRLWRGVRLCLSCARIRHRGRFSPQVRKPATALSADYTRREVGDSVGYYLITEVVKGEGKKQSYIGKCLLCGDETSKSAVSLSDIRKRNTRSCQNCKRVFTLAERSAKIAEVFGAEEERPAAHSKAAPASGSTCDTVAARPVPPVEKRHEELESFDMEILKKAMSGKWS